MLYIIIKGLSTAEAGDKPLLLYYTSEQLDEEYQCDTYVSKDLNAGEEEDHKQDP